MIPAISLDAYTAARERAGLVDRPDRGRIVVSGVDRASFLQGLLTNDVVALKAGEGCYAAYLTAQGRMIADLDVYELGDVMLLVLPRDVKDAVIAKLDQVIFSEDVQLGDVTDTFAQMAVIGPGAASLVARVIGVAVEILGAMAEHGNLRTSWPASRRSRAAQRPARPAPITTASRERVTNVILYQVHCATQMRRTRKVTALDRERHALGFLDRRSRAARR